MRAEGPNAEMEHATAPFAFDAIVDELDVGVVVFGPDGRIRYANDRTLRMLRLRWENVVGSSIAEWDVLGPDGTPVPNDERPFVAAVRTKTPVRDVVLGVQLRDGERHWVLVNARPRLDASGRVEHVILTLSDLSSERRRFNLLQQINDELEQAVTVRTAELARTVARLKQEVDQRSAAERALVDSERLYRSVVRAMAEGVVIHAANGTIRSVNPAAERILGVSFEEIVGLTCEDPGLVLFDERGQQIPGDQTPCERTARTGEPTGRVVLSIARPTGERRWVEIATQPLRSERDSDTGRVGVVTTLSDITAQHSLADQVRSSQRRDAIAAVTSGIAHNFNNALAVLVPNLEEALERSTDEVRAMLEDALRTARGAADLVGQLMIIARAEPARRRAPTELRGCLRDVVTLARRIFRGRISISTVVPEEPIYVLGDEGELHQMLLNLCINARDALSEVDDAALMLEVDVVGTPGQETVVLRVRDNGCGMEEAVVERLGEPFFTTKAPGEGTGLGLATTYATVRDMGGTIECDSVPGEGTEFVIRLPRSAAPPIQPARAVHIGPSRATGRVLIVDDEPLVRRAFTRVLSKHGLDTDEAGDGGEALERLAIANGEYTAILLDLSMRGLRGERAIGRIREAYPDLPIIVVSGFVQDPDALGGANAVLAKPVTGDELMSTIHRVARRVDTPLDGVNPPAPAE